MPDLTNEQTEQVYNALMDASEVLSILHIHGTKGIERTSDAGRIADVFHNVLDAQQALFAATNPPEDLDRRLTYSNLSAH